MTSTSQLLYWGVVAHLVVADEYSEYTVDRLRAISGTHTPQELILLSSGRTIAPGFIRPYGLCCTPDFVVAAAETE